MSFILTIWNVNFNFFFIHFNFFHCFILTIWNVNVAPLPKQLSNTSFILTIWNVNSMYVNVTNFIYYVLY